jgi:DNA-binding transcriptional MerR regulator
MELLKISQLAAKSGVEKSTVQHYIRMQLLPEPVSRPHKNMAYYSSDLVERIRLIKEMQTRYYLPLAKIKAILDDHEGVDEIRTFLAASSLALGESRDASQEDLIQETGLSKANLERIEELGFIRSTTDDDGTVGYKAADVEIARAIASMQAAGLNRENGFLIEDMGFYLEKTRELIGQEVAAFTKVMDKLPRGEVIALARAGLEGTNRLLVALRKRVFLDLLGEMGVKEDITATTGAERT